MKGSLSNIYNPLFICSTIAFIIGTFFHVGIPHPIAIAGVKIGFGSASIILAIAIIIAAISANRHMSDSCLLVLTTIYWFVAEAFLFLGVWIILLLWIDTEILTMPFQFLTEEEIGLYRLLIVFIVFAFPIIGNLTTKNL